VVGEGGGGGRGGMLAVFLFFCMGPMALKFCFTLRGKTKLNPSPSFAASPLGRGRGRVAEPLLPLFSLTDARAN